MFEILGCHFSLFDDSPFIIETAKFYDRRMNIGVFGGADFSSSDDDSDEEIRRKRPRVFRPRINFNRDEIDTRERFRLTSAHVDLLVDKIGEQIQHPTEHNCALSPRQQIQLSLR